MRPKITQRRHVSCASAHRVVVFSLRPIIMIIMISDSTILGLTIGLGGAVLALIPTFLSDGIAAGGALLGASADGIRLGTTIVGTAPLIPIGILLIIMEDGDGIAGMRPSTMITERVTPMRSLAEHGTAAATVQAATVVAETSMPVVHGREVSPEIRIPARAAVTRLLIVEEIRAARTADRIPTVKDTAAVVETAVVRPTLRPIPVAMTTETTARLRAAVMNRRRAVAEAIRVPRAAVDSTAAVAEPVEDSPAAVTAVEEVPAEAVAMVAIQVAAVDQC